MNRRAESSPSAGIERGPAGCDTGAVSRANRPIVLAAVAVAQVGWFAVRSHLIGAAGEPAVVLGSAIALSGGALAVGLPATAARRLERALTAIAADGRRAAVLVAATALAAGTASALVQQPSSWDEDLVVAATRVASEDGLGGFFARYSSLPWLGAQHPPLSILLFAAATRLAGPTVLASRLVAAAAGGGTALACLAIGRRLLAPRPALLGALLLCCSPLFVRLSSAAMNDAPLLLFASTAVLLVLRIGRAAGPATRDALLLGAVVGLGLLTKYTMALVGPVALALAALDGALLRRAREWLLAVLVASLVFGTWLAVAVPLGIFVRQVTWIGEVGRHSITARYLRIAAESLLTKLPSGLGIHAIAPIAAGARSLVRTERGAALRLGAWIVAIAMPLALTVPDNRYFLPAYPALALLGGQGLERSGVAARGLLLCAVLCAATLAYYASTDLSIHARLFAGQ